MNERILKVIKLTQATPEDAKEIVLIHNHLFGSEASICVNCPDQLRLAVKRIKAYHERNK